jgi:hypothetical protein
MQNLHPFRKPKLPCRVHKATQLTVINIIVMLIIIKVNISLLTPVRHIGGVRVYVRS